MSVVCARFLALRPALLLDQLLVVFEELLLAGRVKLLKYGHDLGVDAHAVAVVVRISVPLGAILSANTTR
jgi:hypothetical protein